MGFFRNLWEAIKYIQTHGWAEYQAARKRYDIAHKQQEQKVTKRDRVNAVKQMKAMRKGK